MIDVAAVTWDCESRRNHNVSVGGMWMHGLLGMIVGKVEWQDIVWHVPPPTVRTERSAWAHTFLK